MRFWQAHDLFFEQQGELFRADRAYFVGKAGELGADVAQFEQCYDSGEEHATASTLDGQRRADGIFTRPTIDINGQQVLGAQGFNAFAQVIESLLP